MSTWVSIPVILLISLLYLVLTRTSTRNSQAHEAPEDIWNNDIATRDWLGIVCRPTCASIAGISFTDVSV